MTKRGGRLRNAAHFCFVFVKTVSSFYVVTTYGVFVSKVEGPSMWPTFAGRGDVVVAEALTHRLGELKPGDVVICRRPVKPSESIIKRVLATEGHAVTLYPTKDHHDIRQLTVPRGHVWLQGDNSAHSLDSRQYGAVPLGLVRGRVFAQIWPKLRWVEASLGAPSAF